MLKHMDIEELIQKMNEGVLTPNSYELAESLLNSDLSKLHYFSAELTFRSYDKARLYITIVYNNLPCIFKTSSLYKSDCIDIINRIKALEFENPIYSYSDVLVVTIVNLKTLKLSDDNILSDDEHGILLTLQYYEDDIELLYIRAGNIMKFKKDLSDTGRYDLLLKM